MTTSRCQKRVSVQDNRFRPDLLKVSDKGGNKLLMAVCQCNVIMNSSKVCRRNRLRPDLLRVSDMGDFFFFFKVKKKNPHRSVSVYAITNSSKVSQWKGYNRLVSKVCQWMG